MSRLTTRPLPFNQPGERQGGSWYFTPQQVQGFNRMILKSHSEFPGRIQLLAKEAGVGDTFQHPEPLEVNPHENAVTAALAELSHNHFVQAHPRGSTFNSLEEAEPLSHKVTTAIVARMKQHKFPILALEYSSQVPHPYGIPHQTGTVYTQRVLHNLGTRLNPLIVEDPEKTTRADDQLHAFLRLKQLHWGKGYLYQPNRFEFEKLYP